MKVAVVKKFYLYAVAWKANSIELVQTRNIEKVRIQRAHFYFGEARKSLEFHCVHNFKHLNQASLSIISFVYFHSLCFS